MAIQFDESIARQLRTRDRQDGSACCVGLMRRGMLVQSLAHNIDGNVQRTRSHRG